MDWDFIRENKGLSELSAEKKEQLRGYLTSRDFTPTKQYLDVAEFLLLNQKHLTIDNIFNALHPLDVSLSRSRLYTILDLLERLGVVHKIIVDTNHIYYNLGGEQHAHFICKHCGNIVDVTVELPDTIEGVADRVERFSAILTGECTMCARRKVN